MVQNRRHSRIREIKTLLDKLDAITKEAKAMRDAVTIRCELATCDRVAFALSTKTEDCWLCKQCYAEERDCCEFHRKGGTAYYNCGLGEISNF